MLVTTTSVAGDTSFTMLELGVLDQDISHSVIT
jgi:hypothetical protein